MASGRHVIGEAAVDTMRCVNCRKSRVRTFHQVWHIPRSSLFPFDIVAAARQIEQTGIGLAFPLDCTFNFNAAWKRDRTVYAELHAGMHANSPILSLAACCCDESFYGPESLGRGDSRLLALGTSTKPIKTPAVVVGASNHA
jgi:hypothetical protein